MFYYYYFFSEALHMAGVLYELQRGSFDGKSRVFVPFLRAKSDGRVTSAPTRLSPNTSDKEF